MQTKKIKNTEPLAPRVFVLIPMESSHAIVIARFNSKKVAVFQWDMLSNKISLSQWLKGRIYEYRSDISPDGKHFIYSANQKGEGYTVISKAPWIKAIAFWYNIGCLGGGMFFDNKRYFIHLASFPSLRKNEFQDKSLIRINGTTNFRKNSIWEKRYKQNLYTHYQIRMIMHGWKIKDEDTFSKEIDANLSIEKLYHLNGSNQKGKGTYWESHKIIFKNKVEEKLDWDWCEYRYNKIFYSQNGCLYSLKNIQSIPELIYDFSKEIFTCKQAPY